MSTAPKLFAESSPRPEEGELNERHLTAVPDLPNDNVEAPEISQLTPLTEKEIPPHVLLARHILKSASNDLSVRAFPEIMHSLRTRPSLITRSSRIL